MAKWAVLFLAIVCGLAATAAATELPEPYVVTGKVYCDTCRCGFETNVTTYIPGATVDLQCMDKAHTRVVYTDKAVTDNNGVFKFVVAQDHGDQYCDVVLVKSPWPHCKVVDPGRSRSRVIVTNFNGMSSYHRYANALGFHQDHTLPICGPLLKYYLYSEV